MLSNTTQQKPIACFRKTFCNPVEASINAFLIDTGVNKYSWTQEPEPFGPKLGGKLQTSLKAAGYTPNEMQSS